MRFLKWQDITVGVVHSDNSVSFILPKLNPVVEIYTKEKDNWTALEYKQFIQERIVSSSRRDIEKILHRAGLVEYDEFRLAEATRLLNAKDMFWLAMSENETMSDVIENVLGNIFVKKVDRVGDSLYSPEGMNIKRYAVSHNYYGILKSRLHPFSTDVESEVAVFLMGTMLGVKTCPAWLVQSIDSVESFSKFEYNFAKEYIVHARRLFKDSERTDNEYLNLVTKIPGFKRDIQGMILLDFITRQTDRHLSNIAVKVGDKSCSWYPLYDNGRSLFFEDKKEFMHKAVNDVELYASEFGPVGSYLDHILDFSKEVKVGGIVNLDITKDAIFRSYSSAGLREDRLVYAVDWSHACIQLLKKLT